MFFSLKAEEVREWRAIIEKTAGYFLKGCAHSDFFREVKNGYAHTNVSWLKDNSVRTFPVSQWIKRTHFQTQ